MRFMMMVKSNAEAEAGKMPDEKVLSEMGRFNDEMIKAGVMLGGEGLHASAKGSRVRYAGGKFTVIDGPFAEAKELVAGFWIVQVKSKAEAIDWARRVPFQEGEVEIRPLYEMDELTADVAEKPEIWQEVERSARNAAPPRKPGTTRFMAMLKADRKTEAGAPADENLLAAMGGLITEMVKSGAFLLGEGLQPSAKGARVRYAGAKRTVIDGPFTEAKELVAGVSIIQTKTKEEAIAFAKRCVQIHVDGTDAGEGEMEIRQVFDLEDFPVDPAETPDGWREKERQFRERQV